MLFTALQIGKKLKKFENINKTKIFNTFLNTKNKSFDNKTSYLRSQIDVLDRFQVGISCNSILFLAHKEWFKFHDTTERVRTLLTRLKVKKEVNLQLDRILDASC